MLEQKKNFFSLFRNKKPRLIYIFCILLGFLFSHQVLAVRSSKVGNGTSFITNPITDAFAINLGYANANTLIKAKSLGYSETSADGALYTNAISNSASGLTYLSYCQTKYNKRCDELDKTIYQEVSTKTKRALNVSYTSYNTTTGYGNETVRTNGLIRRSDSTTWAPSCYYIDANNVNNSIYLGENVANVPVNGYGYYNDIINLAAQLAEQRTSTSLILSSGTPYQSGVVLKKKISTGYQNLTGIGFNKVFCNYIMTINVDAAFNNNDIYQVNKITCTSASGGFASGYPTCSYQ
jgi:hypothetical protein